MQSRQFIQSYDVCMRHLGGQVCGHPVGGGFDVLAAAGCMQVRRLAARRPGDGRQLLQREGDLLCWRLICSAHSTVCQHDRPCSGRTACSAGSTCLLGPIVVACPS